ncbi:hypothetical protein BsWGS_10925 [Bradybaena similaris]
MYTSKVNITKDNVCDIWNAANFLQITFILRECEDFLKQNMNRRMCVAIFQQSMLLGSNELITLSWNCLINFFAKLKHSEDILMLKKEDIENLITDQDFKPNSEDDFLKLILSWVNYKTPDFKPNSEDDFLKLILSWVNYKNPDFKPNSEDDFLKLILWWVNYKNPDFKPNSEDDFLKLILSWVNYKNPDFKLNSEDDFLKLILSWVNYKNPDFKPNSEDDFLKLILSWVNYKNPDFKPNSEDDFLKLILSCVNYKNPDFKPNSEDDILKLILSWVNYKKLEETESLTISNETLTVLNCSSTEEVTDSRVSYLAELLSFTKVCLINRQLLNEAVKNEIVLADTTAHEILQSALDYNLRQDMFHEFCPASALHRENSDLENVIICAAIKNRGDVLICRRDHAQWCGLGNNLNRGYNTPKTMTC